MANRVRKIDSGMIQLKIMKGRFPKITKIGEFITPNKFRKYLREAVKRNEVYGCESDNCPLVAATGYAVNGTHYAVHPDLFDCGLSNEQITEGNNPFIRPCPNWAERFVRNFDEKVELSDYEIPSGAMPDAKLALRVLNQVLRDIKNGG